MDTKTILAYGVFVADDRSEMSRQKLYEWLVEAALLDGPKDLDSLVQSVGSDLTSGVPLPSHFVKQAIDASAQQGTIQEQSDHTYRLSATREKELGQAEERFSSHRKCFYDHILSTVQRIAGNLSESLATAIEQNLDLDLQNLFSTLNFDQLQAIARDPGHANEALQNGSVDSGLQQLDNALRSLTTATRSLLIVEGVKEALQDLPDECAPYLVSLHLRSCYSYLLKLDPGLQRYTADLLARRMLFLDTNVVVSLLMDIHSNHAAVKEVIELSRQSGCRLFVTTEVIRELEYLFQVSERFARRLLTGDHLVRSLIQAGRAVILAQYASESEKVSWEQFSNLFHPLPQYLEQLGITTVEVNTDTLKNDADWAFVFSKVTGAKEERRKISLDPREVRLDAVEIDAANLLFALKKREEFGFDEMGPTVWFLTLDGSLLLAQSYMHSTARRPFVKRLYDWGSLVLGHRVPSLKSKDLSEYMKALVRSKLGILPEDQGIDIGLVRLLVESKLLLRHLAKLPPAKAKEAVISLQMQPEIKAKLERLELEDVTGDEEIDADLVETLQRAIFDREAAEAQDRAQKQHIGRLEEQVQGLTQLLRTRDVEIREIQSRENARQTEVQALQKQYADTLADATRQFEILGAKVDALSQGQQWQDEHPWLAFVYRLLGKKIPPAE